MATRPPSVDAALKLLDDLSSAQKTLQRMNEELLRASVDDKADVPAMREVVRAQHEFVQAITEKMLAALSKQ